MFSGNLTNFVRFSIVLYRKMSSSASVLLPPAGVRGMKVLDREKFLRNIEVAFLKVTEHDVAIIRSHCIDYFLKIENFKPVQSLEDANFKKCIFLNPDKIRVWTDIPEEDRTALSKCGIDITNFDIKEIQISYENFKHNAIFNAVLPESDNNVTGFSQIAHIIHLNLKDNLLEYRHLIGQVLVDKILSCRTVVIKSNVIDNIYRNFNMEVIAGEEDFIVNVKENQCTFWFDFSKVYWNPRLGKEHNRITDLFRPKDVLFDVFCGVGPFSIPAAKRGCKVYANDLNPESYKYLNANAKRNLNKRDLNLFQSYNLDGKDFINTIFKEYLIEYCKGNEKLEKNSKIHITMNLPAMAVKFLRNFNGLIKDEKLIEKLDKDILIYMYCFVNGSDLNAVAQEMTNENIGCDVTANIVSIIKVRHVAPKKDMLRVTLKLTKDLIIGVNSDSDEPPIKKMCTDAVN